MTFFLSIIFFISKVWYFPFALELDSVLIVVIIIFFSFSYLCLTGDKAGGLGTSSNGRSSFGDGSRDGGARDRRSGTGSGSDSFGEADRRPGYTPPYEEEADR